MPTRLHGAIGLVMSDVALKAPPPFYRVVLVASLGLSQGKLNLLCTFGCSLAILYRAISLAASVGAGRRGQR